MDECIPNYYIVYIIYNTVYIISFNYGRISEVCGVFIRIYVHLATKQATVVIGTKDFVKPVRSLSPSAVPKQALSGS